MSDAERVEPAECPDRVPEDDSKSDHECEDHAEESPCQSANEAESENEDIADDDVQNDRLEGCFDVLQTKCISKRDFIQFLSNQRVIVIGIIGKSEFTHGIRNPHNSKESIFDSSLQKDIFWISHATNDSSKSSVRIQGYHDRDSGRIFLYFQSVFDANVLSHQLSLLTKENSSEDCQSLFSGCSFDHAKYMLFMFHVCHLIILYHPNHSIDLSYIHLFKTLDAIRNKLLPVMSKAFKNLENLGLDRDWLLQGRQCPPRMLFYFATAPLALRGAKGMAELVKRDGNVAKYPPIRKMEFALEDQIYQIFRKARIVTSSPNCLFNIPSRDGYVYIENGDESSSSSVDPTLNRMNKFIRMLALTDEPDISSGPFLPYFSDMHTAESRRQRCFSRFLETHLESIRIKGTDADTKGGLELPTAHVWYATLEVLLKVFKSSFRRKVTKRKRENPIEKVISVLEDFTTIQKRFSDSRCSKALALAFSAYKEGLQPHYVEEFHNAKLLQALSVFSMNARGPASAQYAEMLAKECNNYWKSGRQMCEVYSLSGNHCINRRHVLPGEDPHVNREANKEEEKDTKAKSKRVLPSMPHNSGITFTCACNCGRKLGSREDPFDILEANFKFFSEMEQECCQGLERFNFPYYDPSIQRCRNSASSTGKKSSKNEDLGGIDDVKLSRTLEGLDMTDEAESRDALQTLADMASDKEFDRQISLIEPVPHMLTNDTPKGKLPLFPSWSLIQLGSSYLYACNTGLTQPGIANGSKTLFTWEIHLKNVLWDTIEDNWPNLVEMLKKKPSFIPVRGKPAPLTVKAFIGFEYECPRGHRFLAASPDKAMTSQPTGVRDAASKVLSSHMPLYMACPCKGKRQCMGQLMRVHIVTPKAPIHVTVFPKVQPSTPDGPIFHTGISEPVKLSHNTYWVLRLPYIYSGENGAHVAPQGPDEDTGRFFKGALGVTEEFEDKTMKI